MFFGGGPRRRGEPDTKYYDLLGVPKTATKEEVTKSYRTKARQLHPDRNPDPQAKERFQELTNAYEVLTDPKKREIYDKYGEEGLKEGGGGDPFGNPHDIFSHFFGGGAGGGRRQSGPEQAEDISFQYRVTLKELYVGKNSKLKISRRIICKTCTGRGSMKEGADQVCAGCKGKGIRIVIQRIGPMITQSQAVCDACRGEGVVVAEKDRCTSCKGKKVEKEEKQIEVHVLPGTQFGEVQTFYGEGEQLPDMEPGDVKIQIVEKEEEDEHFAKFKRKGDDLIFEHKITLVEALTGFVFHLPHFDERILVIKSEPGDIVKPGDIKVIEGEGMPRKGNAFTKGKLYIKFDVQFPKPGSVNDKMKAALCQIWEKPTLQPVLEGEDIHYEEVVAKNIDLATYNEAEEEEDDDEEGGHGGRRVECMNNIM